METSITYYIALLALFIIGIFVVKKVASCLVKSIVTVVLLVLMAAIYWLYMR